MEAKWVDRTMGALGRGKGHCETVPTRTITPIMQSVMRTSKTCSPDGDQLIVLSMVMVSGSAV